MRTASFCQWHEFYREPAVIDRMTAASRVVLESFISICSFSRSALQEVELFATATQACEATSPTGFVGREQVHGHTDVMDTGGAQICSG